MTADRPWYRYPWVWALFVPPVAAITFWAVIITRFAGPPSLVVDDYAKIGLAYQQQRARDAAATELGVTARLHLGRGDGVVTVLLRGPEPLPRELDLRLTHPTQAARDRGTRLERLGSGIYRGELGPGAAGRWRVEIAPPAGDWRLAGELFAGQADLELGARGGSSSGGRPQPPVTAGEPRPDASRTAPAA